MTGLARLHLLLEGQTEETITRDIIGPHLESVGWFVCWSIVKTKRPAAGPAHRGGVGSWAHIDRDIRLLLRDSSLTVVTTILDYYAFPRDAPGMTDRPSGPATAKVGHVERSMAEAVGDKRFVPNLVLHETESWVFAAADQLAELYDDAQLATRLRKDVAAARGPELINDGPSTAPSKRLMRYRPDYAKTLDGPIAIAELGLARLRACCPHLDTWLTGLEAACPRNRTRNSD
jgi:hypothetical protein